MLKIKLNTFLLLFSCSLITPNLTFPQQGSYTCLSVRSTFETSAKKGKRGHKVKLERWIKHYVKKGVGLKISDTPIFLKKIVKNQIYITTIDGIVYALTSVRLEKAEKIKLVINANETVLSIDAYSNTTGSTDEYLISFRFDPTYSKFFAPFFNQEAKTAIKQRYLDPKKEQVRTSVEQILAFGYKSINDDDKKRPALRITCTNKSHLITFGTISRELQKRYQLKTNFIRLFSLLFKEGREFEFKFIFGARSFFLDVYFPDSTVRLTSFKLDKKAHGLFKEVPNRGPIKTQRKPNINNRDYFKTKRRPDIDKKSLAYQAQLATFQSRLDKAVAEQLAQSL